MSTYEYDLARARMREDQQLAAADARSRRLMAVRRWERRAQRASQRAARANAAVI